MGRLRVAATVAGGEGPLARRRGLSVQPGIAPDHLLPGPTAGVHSPSAVFSVGVLLQLNISTRLSVGPSRSVIYTILLIVSCG